MCHQDGPRESGRTDNLLNGTHQLLCFSYYVIIVGEIIDILQKNTRALLDASKEVGLELIQRKLSKYMLVSHCQKTGQRQSIKIANRSFREVSKFKYLGTTLTVQNCINEIRGMLATIRFRVFCHPSCCPGM
jgi:hypothetical protein